MTRGNCLVKNATESIPSINRTGRPTARSSPEGVRKVQLPRDSSRRRILILAAGTAPAYLLAASTSGCSEVPVNDRQLIFKSLGEALSELDRLTRAEALQPAPAWNWTQTLNHCAQSVEYSMTGFPQAKSQVFQRTVGTTAFKVFSWRGRMTHDLGEPIPGAPLLDASTPVAAAVERLKQAALAFTHWTAPLRPHFAYGELSKAEYEQAHAMHLANHFSAFRQKA
jgi:hypothetical protein